MPASRSASAFLAFLITSLPCVLPVTPRAQDVSEPAQVLVLGTYHFANPGLDVVKTDVAYVLAPRKKAEIEAIVDALARFRPTRIAVEHRPTAAARLDSLCHAYRSRLRALGRDEFPFGAVMAYAETHDTAFVVETQEELARIAAEMNRQQAEPSIG
jgi:hypothetical protein